MNGQLTSGCAPATPCRDLADEPEKKAEILSVNEGELAAGGGGDDVAGELNPPPAEHPETTNASNAAIGIKPHERIR
jgi:hypothetical protein